MCKDVGFCQMLERDQKTIKLLIDGKEEVYQILKVEEFSSERKRMSVFVQNSQSEVINFIK